MDQPFTQHNLNQFTGTENWYRHPIGYGLLYTDGVQYIAEMASAYWFLDIVATECMPLEMEHEFLVIVLTSQNTQGQIDVTDGNGNHLKTKRIKYTDFPPGKWEFFLTNHVLYLPSEH